MRTVDQIMGEIARLEAVLTAFRKLDHFMETTWGTTETRAIENRIFDLRHLTAPDYFALDRKM